MFSSKKKEKNKNSTSSTSTTTTKHYVSQITHTVTVGSTTRSKSVSYSSENGKPTGSLLSLQNSGVSLLPPTPLELERSRSYTGLGKVSTDAKPFVPTNINLNYQSPYRNSPVYHSFHTGTGVRAPSVTTYPQKPTPTLTSSVPKPLPSAPPNKKLVVKKTGKFYDKDSNVPTYKTSSKNRGEALIINNIMFRGEHERKGAELDEKKMKDLFKQIGFNVTVKPNLNKTNIEMAVKTFSQKSSLKNCDISVVVVMSHGTQNATLGGTEVFGIDENAVPVENLLQYFTADKCKNMVNKPKIFILQCCRGDNEQFSIVQTDARLKAEPRPHADMLIAYSTLPGFVSHRDPERGTWYIQTLCDVFSEHAHEHHVEDLLKIVDVELARLGTSYKQTSSYESRGFKRCYLHPC